MLSEVDRITKVLSKNDAGVDSKKEHGILVPKDEIFQSFFPALDETKENPKATITLRDAKTGDSIELNYTFYNKTKNEYRLTRAGKYLRAHGAVAGSHLSFTKGKDGTYEISLTPPHGIDTVEQKNNVEPTNNDTLGAVVSSSAVVTEGEPTQVPIRRRAPRGFASWIISGWKSTE